MLFQDQYSSGCPNVIINGNTYNESTLYREVKGFGPVSQYKLLEQNDDDILTKMNKFPNFEKGKLNGYYQQLYAKPYMEWDSEGCVMKNPKTGDDLEITPSMLSARIDSRQARVMLCTKIVMFFTYVMLFSQLVEYSMLHMYKEEALSKPTYDKIVKMRRALTIILELVCAGLLVIIYRSSKDNMIEFLAGHECTNDDAVNQTFKSIKDFNQKSFKHLWMNLGFLMVILLADFIGLAEKFVYDRELNKSKSEKDSSNPNQSKVNDKLLDQGANTMA